MADDPNAASRPPAEPTPSEAAEAADDWTAEEVIAADGAGAMRSSDGKAGTVIPDPSSWLPGLEGRSTTPGVCPFLRAAGPDDAIGFPIESPDVTNRCAALREPVPQSLRQQELVCLTSGHINCPRYLRGALVASERPAVRRRLGMGLTPAIAAALAVLVLSFGVSVAFVVANGGLTLPVAAVGATRIAVGEHGRGRAVGDACRAAHAAGDRHCGRDAAVLVGEAVGRAVSVAERDARTDPSGDAHAEADLEPIRPAQAVSRTSPSAGSTSSGRGTTWSASRTTSACRWTG